MPVFHVYTYGYITSIRTYPLMETFKSVLPPHFQLPLSATSPLISLSMPIHLPYASSTPSYCPSPHLFSNLHRPPTHLPSISYSPSTQMGLLLDFLRPSKCL